MENETKQTNKQINLKLGIPQNLSIRSILIRLTSPAHQATRSTSLSTNCWFTMHGKIQPGLRGVKSPFAMNSCQYCTDLQPIHYNKPSVKSETSQFHSDWFIVFYLQGMVPCCTRTICKSTMSFQCHSNVIPMSIVMDKKWCCPVALHRFLSQCWAAVHHLLSNAGVVFQKCARLTLTWQKVLLIHFDEIWLCMGVLCHVPNAKLQLYKKYHPPLVCGHDLPFMLITQPSNFQANNVEPAMPSEIQGMIANSRVQLQNILLTRGSLCLPRCKSGSSGSDSVGFKSQPPFTTGELEHWPASFHPWKIVPTDRRLEALHCHHARPWFKACCKENYLLETRWM